MSFQPFFRGFLVLSVLVSFSLLLATCGKKQDSSGESGAEFIYIASGTAYAGQGVTTSSASNTIAKYNSDGTLNMILEDFTEYPGDTPVAMIDYDDDYLLLAVENTAGRRLEKVAKDGSGRVVLIQNATAFSAALRSVARSSDGGYLVSKGTAIEKFTLTKSRVTIGATTAYVNAPGSTCATSTTLAPNIQVLPSGNILMLHAAASPNNQINVIASTGYTGTTDCLSTTEGPTANHYPTTSLLHSSGKLLVAYSNGTAGVNDIYSYDLSDTALSNPILAARDPGVLSGMSAMAEMSDGSVLVSMMNQNFNTIEKFTFNSSTGVLTRVGTTPLIEPNLYIRSVSAMVVTN